MTASKNNAKVELNIASGVFRCFQDNKDTLCDFTVIVGETKFNCHKFVLSSCSGFFSALMRTDMREKSESRCTIHGITPEIFGLILDSIYRGHNVLKIENMLKLWHAANQLQIKFLFSECEKFVNENITLENYWDIYQDAKLLGSTSIVDEIKNLMISEFTSIVNSRSFMELSLEDLEYILENKGLSVNADFSVNAVLKWTGSIDTNLNSEESKKATMKNSAELPFGNQKQQRKDESIPLSSHLGELLAIIPLDKASDTCLVQLMNNKFIIENKEAVRLVNKVAATRVGDTKSVKVSVPNREQNSMDNKVNNVCCFFAGMMFILLLMVLPKDIFIDLASSLWDKSKSNRKVKQQNHYY